MAARERHGSCLQLNNRVDYSPQHWAVLSIITAIITVSCTFPDSHIVFSFHTNSDSYEAARWANDDVIATLNQSYQRRFTRAIDYHVTVEQLNKSDVMCEIRTGVTAQITRLYSGLYPGIIWNIPRGIPDYTPGYILGAPRVYPTSPDYTPIRCQVGYSLGDRDILWEYMITINYKFKQIIN